jgi:hypothetical protein
VEYEDLDEWLKEELKSIVSEDNYGLSPKTLYNNIRFSTGTNMELSKIFEVPYSLVTQIKMLNNKD